MVCFSQNHFALHMEALFEFDARYERKYPMDSATAAKVCSSSTLLLLLHIRRKSFNAKIVRKVLKTSDTTFDERGTCASKIECIL